MLPFFDNNLKNISLGQEINIHNIPQFFDNNLIKTAVPLLSHLSLSNGKCTYHSSRPAQPGVGCRRKFLARRRTCINDTNADAFCTGKREWTRINNARRNNEVSSKGIESVQQEWRGYACSYAIGALRLWGAFKKS